MKRLALFDFDGTLYKGDSFIAFALYAVGKVSFFKNLLRNFPSLLRWKLGLLSGSVAKERLFQSLYQGWKLRDFNEKCAGFATQISTTLRPEVTKHLQNHIESGDTVAIVSASPANWIRPWADAMGIRHVVATEIEQRDGVLTGRFSTPNCVGQEKVGRIKEAFPDSADCEIWAYGDSASDKAMLALADHPVWMRS